MNIKDIGCIDTNGQGMIWWNGALKEQLLINYQNAIEFLQQAEEITYNLQFDGISSKLALDKVLSHNSREKMDGQDLILATGRSL